MKATSLSLNLFGGCNAKCPFCIASATWKTGIRDNAPLLDAVPRALSFAKYHNVDTVLITGSGEPTLHREAIFSILRQCNELHIPITELQTNGALLASDPEYLADLKAHGLNTISVSVASVDPQVSAELMGIQCDYLELAQAIAHQGMLCRISLNLIDRDREVLLKDLLSVADKMRDCGVHQWTLRELGIPEQPQDSDEAEQKIRWVRDHALSRETVREVLRRIEEDGTLLRRLSYGAAVYDYRGLSVCIASCMTEQSDPDEIRSLILMPDGHVYHSWNYRGSILL